MPGICRCSPGAGGWSASSYGCRGLPGDGDRLSRRAYAPGDAPCLSGEPVGRQSSVFGEVGHSQEYECLPNRLYAMMAPALLQRRPCQEPGNVQLDVFLDFRYQSQSRFGVIRVLQRGLGTSVRFVYSAGIKLTLKLKSITLFKQFSATVKYSQKCRIQQIERSCLFVFPFQLMRHQSLVLL